MAAREAKRATMTPIVRLLLIWLPFISVVVIVVEAFQLSPERSTRRQSFSIVEHGHIQTIPKHSDSSSTSLGAAARARSSKNINQVAASEVWFPLQWMGSTHDEYATIEEEEEARRAFEEPSLALAGELIVQRLLERSADGALFPSNTEIAEMDDSSGCTVHPFAVGRFVDLTFAAQGEQVLESLFCTKKNADTLVGADDAVIKGAVMAVQSLLGVGMLVGSQGTPEQIERSLAHLIERQDREEGDRDLEWWDAASTRRLKYNLNRAPGVQLLRQLKRKRTPQGAFDLLVQIGAWTKHEDLGLLRSGFALRFSSEEEAMAEEAAQSTHDPDSILGIRQDLRNQKVYTIDSASTTEIDDGLTVERFTDANGVEKQRIWIHIADADRWAPRDSKIFEAAKRRAVSLYLPQGSIPMMPKRMSVDSMSLKANKDVCALSLGVELNEDGSIIDSSLVVTPSIVCVDYRLTYEEADEMLEEGIAFSEEWQLGALLTAATKRREFRMSKGSSEAFVPNQIPKYSISLYNKGNSDEVEISVNVEVSHNAGKNQSSVDIFGSDSRSSLYDQEPVSASNTLVTEMMILAGEAIGKWKLRIEKREQQSSKDEQPLISNSLRLPFRTQPKPDFDTRAREKAVFMDLLAYNIGDGYCHAWYARRFLSPVKVQEEAKPHFGLGLDCYVQWSSPIRRFQDLQVHAAVKRYLRREKVNELISAGQAIPEQLTYNDLGIGPPIHSEGGKYILPADSSEVDADIDYGERAGLLGVSRTVQFSAQRYWMLEHIRREREKDASKMYEALVLGCIDPARKIYVVFIYELGFETKYLNPVGSLQTGTALKLHVASVTPRTGQIKWVRAQV